MTDSERGQRKSLSDWKENWWQLILWDWKRKRLLGGWRVAHLISDWTLVVIPRRRHADKLYSRLSPASSSPMAGERESHSLQMTSMTGREGSLEKPKVKMLSPGYGIDKSRLHGSGFRSKSFAITDLLGLETDLQSRPSGPGLSGNGDVPSIGIGGFPFASGSLPLGLGFLCSLAAQQPPGAPCFLPSHLPLLQSRTESQYMQNFEQQRDAYSGTTRLQVEISTLTVGGIAVHSVWCWN